MAPTLAPSPLITALAMERPSEQPAGRTLCEINCQLVTANAGPTLGRLVGHAAPDVFVSSWSPAGPTGLHQSARSPGGHVLVTAAAGRRSRTKLDEEEGGAGLLGQLLGQLLSPLPGLRSRLQAATGLQLLPTARSNPLAWHPCKPLLAAGDEADIHIYDYAGKVPSLGQPPAGGAPPPLAPQQVLSHESQRGVAALAWRPNSGGCLAAACSRGVCLWHVGGRGPPGAGGSSGAWMSWLRPPPGAGPLTCLAWHPRGHLLAAASAQGAGFLIWDVATGACTPLRAGTEPVLLLSWSPCGSYLLAGHPSGSFRVWQTHSWWPQKWSAAESGAAAAGGLAGAAWSPDSRTLLLAYSAPAQLVSLHFTSDPPSLQAQLLPLSLPEIAAKANGAARGAGSGGAVVEGMAWDARAQRLAVALGGGHPAAGSVALFDTRCDPILSARFIGLINGGEPLAAPGAGLGAAAGAARGRAWECTGGGEIEEAEDAGPAGPAAAAEARGGPARLAFQPSFGQGALLAVRRGSLIATLPLYFSG